MVYLDDQQLELIIIPEDSDMRINEDNKIAVKNLNNTSKEPHANQCDNYLAEWKYYMNKKYNKIYDNIKCCNVDCNNKAEVGAHVKKTDPNDKKWYIVPLCKKCNTIRNNKFRVPLSYLVWLGYLKKQNH